ncbi:MAG: hypothetical protein LBI16_03725 [Burkholderiales bacterium]|jgi:transposase-like protein|nr:hypothetical protein [Burkholderiales bacterium]
MQCTRCGSTDYVKNGSYKGSQRYICKECHKAFSDRVRKFTYADKERFLRMYLNNMGIRKSALFMGCSSSMPNRWIREFAQNLRRRLQKAEAMLEEGKIPSIIEMDEIYTRVKKGAQESKYGLLILEGQARLLRIS